MKRNMTVSLDVDLIARVERLAQPDENRSALVARLLAQAARIAEDAEIDALYDRALAAHPVTEEQQRALQQRARAAYRSVHGPRR